MILLGTVNEILSLKFVWDCKLFSWKLFKNIYFSFLRVLYPFSIITQHAKKRWTYTRFQLAISPIVESGNDCESVHHISVGDSYFMNGSTQTDSPEHFDVGTQTPLSFTKPVYRKDAMTSTYGLQRQKQKSFKVQVNFKSPKKLKGHVKTQFPTPKKEKKILT